MTHPNEPWFQKWFNQDYLKLYKNRDSHEAEQQIDFFIQALELKGNENILDLGCGSGRHSIALAKKGFSVIGVDQSEPLLAIARQTAKEEGIQVDFQKRDMRHLEGLGPFDVVFSLFTSFGYFDLDQENEAVITQVHNCLKANGKFVLDYLNPAAVRKTMKDVEVIEVENEPVNIIRREINGSFVKQITMGPKHYEEKVKAYTPDVLRGMLEKNGFEILKIWGDYAGQELTEDTPRQIFYASAPGIQ